MQENVTHGRVQLALAKLCFVSMATLVATQAHANLILNGSFENRTDAGGADTSPAAGFSYGDPDNWDDLLDQGLGTYLVHETHPTVPGFMAKDGEIIVGGNQQIWLSQIFTTTQTGRLNATWWGNNETTTGTGTGTENTADESPLYSTGVDFWDLDGNRIESSGFRYNYDPDQITWFKQSFTTSGTFSPGSYEVRLYIGGRSSADDLIISQVPNPATLALVGLGLAGLRWKRRRV